jgi:hypothetical protein
MIFHLGRMSQGLASWEAATASQYKRYTHGHKHRYKHKHKRKQKHKHITTHRDGFPYLWFYQRVEFHTADLGEKDSTINYYSQASEFRVQGIMYCHAALRVYNPIQQYIQKVGMVKRSFGFAQHARTEISALLLVGRSEIILVSTALGYYPFCPFDMTSIPSHALCTSPHADFTSSQYDEFRARLTWEPLYLNAFTNPTDLFPHSL